METHKKSDCNARNIAIAKSVEQNTFVTIIDGRKTKVKMTERAYDTLLNIMTAVVGGALVVLVSASIAYLFGG